MLVLLVCCWLRPLLRRRWCAAAAAGSEWRVSAAAVTGSWWREAPVGRGRCGPCFWSSQRWLSYVCIGVQECSNLPMVAGGVVGDAPCACVLV